MSNLPPIKRLAQEDYHDQPWIGRLLGPLNQFLQSIYAAFNNGFTMNENMIAQVKTLTIAGAVPNLANGKYVTQWNWPFPATRPVGLWIGNITDISAAPIVKAVIVLPVSVAWTYGAGVIYIQNIAGLDITRTYSATFFVSGG